MQVENYLSFVGLSALLIIAPGPNAALIVATAASRGMRAGFLTLIGILTAQSVQLALAGIGLTWLTSQYTQAFDMLRYVGAGYLAYLGIQTWRSATRILDSEQTDTIAIWQGMIVGISNPETLTLAATFLPQFIDHAEPFGVQFAILATTFTLLGILFNGAQAVIGGLGHRMLTSDKSRIWVARGSGIALIIAGGVLAELHQS